MTRGADTTESSPAPTGGPLSGCRILVTRARRQAGTLAEPLAALGADVLIAPVIDTADPDDWGPADAAIDDLGSYDWVVLTSVNAVERFIDRMGERGRPATDLDRVRVAVVGPATAERLAEFGTVPALVPDDYRAEGLLEAFMEMGAGPGWRVLVPRAAQAREILPDFLRDAGAEVNVVPVYRTVPALPDHAVIERLRSGEVDVVTFTSPSTVRHFVAWLEAADLDPAVVMRRVAAASIGPVTTEALHARGYDAAMEAAHSTAAGLVEAIVVHQATGGVCGC